MSDYITQCHPIRTLSLVVYILEHSAADGAHVGASCMCPRLTRAGNTVSTSHEMLTSAPRERRTDEWHCRMLRAFRPTRTRATRQCNVTGPHRKRRSSVRIPARVEASPCRAIARARSAWYPPRAQGAGARGTLHALPATAHTIASRHACRDRRPRIECVCRGAADGHRCFVPYTSGGARCLFTCMR